ncbi:DUF58 domain-containing protein [Glaciihabitans sp. dw_435]|uniref:DUF58 domain-containing protein n=1 Tax=Glaciihabitans sp. dw_435 TaxID=2720081 RepID=UPI001BD63D21|nr:DUF58 domain-containing protein [Glaciihabitans sp. dw_435]
MIRKLLSLASRRVVTTVGPVLSVISGVGWLVLGAAVVTCVIGWSLGWQEFVYLGVTLAAALLVALAFIFGRSTYSVEIELNPLRVVAGDRALGRLLVTNTRDQRSGASRVELPVGAGSAEFIVPPLDSKVVHEELFAVPTNRRAVIVAGPAISVRGDQLGLLRRTVTLAESVELFVHPITTPLAPSAAGLVRDLEGQVTKTISNNDIAFHALRAYEPGDDRRYVHWRTSARTGQLMVRQFEETRRSQLVLLFSSERSYYASDDEFELAVSVLASLGVQVIRDGTTINVLTEDRELRARTVSSLLDDSCRIEALTTPFASTRDFARSATRRLPAPSVVMVVAGSLFPVSDFRSVEALFGQDTQTVGFRVEQGGTPRLSSINRLRVATIGSLDDLPRLVRRAT